MDRQGEFYGLDKPVARGTAVPLVFNCYDAPHGSTAEARLDDGAWQPMPAFAAMNEKIGLAMPHHFRLQADTSALAPGRHTFAWSEAGERGGGLPGVRFLRVRTAACERTLRFVTLR